MTENAGLLLDDDASFASLGIERDKPGTWENGRRSREQLTPGEWEWWYMDAHFTNGYMAVSSLHIAADEHGVNRPFITLNIANGGQKVVDQIIQFPAEAMSAAVDHADMTLSNSYFRSLDGLDRFRVFVDPAENGGNGLDIELVRTVPSYRPGTGRWDFNGTHFSWLCAVPGATARGTLTVDGTQIPVEGNGYHDHNWGDVPMDHLLGDWLWGRAEIDGTTVVSASVRFREIAGGRETPLLYIARGEEVLVDAINNQLTCLEGAKIAHPDTGKRISSDCVYIVDEGPQAGGTVRFNGNKTVVASYPFTNSSIDWQTWYTRYAATVTVDVNDTDGARLQASDRGTLEVMDFFGRPTERH
ncbi:hypothetical protein ACFXG4_24190 [Nocardia sp. NPDC059246]|uniref:hypothetical protein n=1 Tax=unclassified Nocardia TaxID=2637762 RepID=UPI0036CD5807